MSSTATSPAHTPAALVAFAWTLVGVPLLYGLDQTMKTADAPCSPADPPCPLGAPSGRCAAGAQRWSEGSEAGGDGQQQVGAVAARADLPVGTRRPRSVAPVARRSQVAASVSTTFGGVPRVCRGPSMHWTATCGGTRSSTERPGTCWASQRADVFTAAPPRPAAAARLPRPATAAPGRRRRAGPRPRSGRASARRDRARRNGADRASGAPNSAGSVADQAAPSSASASSSRPSMLRLSRPSSPAP